MGFNTWEDFANFDKHVRYESRFLLNPAAIEFLQNVKRTLSVRTLNLQSDFILYRAQIGHREYEDEDVGQTIIAGYLAERMKPIPHNGVEGRANPKGISYLYLSNDENTCLAELRPSCGQLLSSAQFKTKRDLRLVDCCSVARHYNQIECIFKPPQSQEEITNAIWSRINEAFTTPVTKNDSVSDYVPTQILAELFKTEGFDGICFKSGLGLGHNITLFNPDDADLVNCTVMETKSVSYEFSECANRYYVRGH